MTLHATDFASILEKHAFHRENPHRGSYAIALALMHVAEAIEGASVHTGTCITDVSDAITDLANATLERKQP